MQLSMSKLSRASVFRKRHTSSKFAGSTTTNGSIAARFFDLILSPNFCSRRGMISAEVIAFGPLTPLAAERSAASGKTVLGLGRRRLFLVDPRELVLLLQRLLRIGIAQFRRQQRV